MITVSFILVSCEKEESVPKVDENGLTKNITDLVPQYILDEMIELGMPINGGANPPVIDNTYFASPFILISSNRPSDFPGQSFAGYQVTFKDQDNDELSIMVDYINGSESGEGLGSFIVGEECAFSVFVQINAISGGTSAKLTHVISGTIANDGIEGLYFANFMIDNNDNPSGIWIENGEGRVIYDQDGFSEILGSARAWDSNLPACPCTYAEAQNMDETDCPSGRWSDCGGANQDYHFGGTSEVRWLPASTGAAGQQCVYDASGQLITQGIAAGSPDRVSPGACGFWSWLVSSTGTTATYEGHRDSDMVPWETGSCTDYLANWKANNKNSCSGNTENIVSGIDHMLLMVGQMTCQEITAIFEIIDDSDDATQELKDYIQGNLNYKPVDLKNQLTTVYTENECDDNLDEINCSALKKAIDNL